MSTIEVVAVPGGSARLAIFSRDHCPPHATCLEKSGRWTVRISFSFLDPGVGILSVFPPQNSPGMGVINDLAHAVQRNLPECRRLWWTYQEHNPANQVEGACCLNNRARAGETIAEARYDPVTSTTYIRFSDGSTMGQVV
jgi:hypothetical protein